MRKILKKSFSVFLALVMVLGIAPLSLFASAAEDNNVLRVVTGTAQWEGAEINTEVLGIVAGGDYDISIRIHTSDIVSRLLVQTNGPLWGWIISNINFTQANLDDPGWRTVTGRLNLTAQAEPPSLIQIVKQGGGPNVDEVVTFWIDDFTVRDRVTGQVIYTENFEGASHAFTPASRVTVVKESSIGEPDEPPPPPPTGAWHEVPSLWEAYKDYFPIGNIDSTGYSNSANNTREMFIRHYNAITAENNMKPNNYGTRATFPTFSAATVNMMNFAVENNMEVHGHTLAWHSQSAAWLNPAGQTRAEARLVLEEFITRVAGHFETAYPGKVVSWDVVNEAFLNGNGFWRESLRESAPWFRAYANGADAALGEFGGDYLYDAFVFARKAAPSAKLYYNDYNMDTPSKFRSVANMVEELNAKWATDTVNNPEATATAGAYTGRKLIEVVGLQSHFIVGANLRNVENSIIRMIEAGVPVAITELDIAIPNTRWHSDPAQAVPPTEEQLMTQAIWAARLFQIFKQYSDHIERVTWWGIGDANSWLNTNDATYGLLFDRNREAKPMYWAVLDPDGFLELYGDEGGDDQFRNVRQFGFAPQGTPDIMVNDISQWNLATQLASASVLNANRFVDNTTAGATGQFRVLWDDGFLYVRADVSKDGPLLTGGADHEEDSVEVFFSETNHRRDGYFAGLGDGQYRVNFQNRASFANHAATAAQGFASQAFVVDGGYVVQMKIPFRNVTPGDYLDIGFDAQVNTRTGNARTGIAVWCDTSNGRMWQTPEPLGQLTLVTGTTPFRTDTREGNAVFGSPAGIDDPLWIEAETLPVNKWTSDAEVRGATGVAKTMWDPDFLYVLIDVEDSLIDSSNGNPWLTDSVEFCLSKDGSKVAGYPSAANGGQYRVTTVNTLQTNPAAIATGVRRDVKLTDGGYIIYIAIPIDNRNIDPEVGAMMAFDIQINDAANGARFGIATWSDHTASGFSNSTRFGDLNLLPKEDGPEVQPGVPTLLWEMAKEDAILSLEDGAVFTAAGPASARNTATFTVRKDTIIPEVHGWDFLGISTTAVDVIRPEGNDGFRISAAELGMVAGETYIFDISGRRPDGAHRAAFGTINTAGTIAINGAIVGPVANNHPTRPGYFDMKRTITHNANTEYYIFYGVGSANNNVNPGNFQLYNVTVSKANPFVIYSTDFSDGTRGLVTGTIDGQHSVIPDRLDPDNNVYRSIIPPATSGNWHGYDLTNPDYEWPAGATYRATFVVRRAEGNTVNARLRLAVQTGGTVSSWDIAGHTQALGLGWTTYTVGPFTLDPGVGVQSFQLIRNNETWAGTMELDSVMIEVIEAPAEELVGLWESKEDLPSISHAYREHFTVGNILDRLPSPALEEMFLHQYNSITMENAMKPAGMSPAKGEYTFENADAVVNWALDNDVEVIGHALLWHSQSAAWLTNNPVTGAALTRAEARENLEEFVTTVAKHFAGRVSAWDVANEVFTGNGGAGAWHANMRTNSPWWLAYNNGRNAAIGEQPWDFLYDAFVFARLADPDATLIKNDFNCNSLPKARNMRDMANELNAKWALDTVNNTQAKSTYEGTHAEIVTQYIADGGRILVETLGLQMHHGTTTTIRTPASGNVNQDWNVENSFLIYTGAVGITLAVTELDIQAGAGFAYNPVHQYGQYKDLFELLLEYDHMVDRVTFWGVSDVQSWRGPQSPTLFARPTVNDPYFRAKPAFHTVVDLPPEVIIPPLGLPWSLADSIGDLEDGTAITTERPLFTTGTAAATVRENLVLQEIHGWPELAQTFKGLEVARPAAADSLRFDPKELGLEEGVTYIWEIQGVRTSGTHRPAFAAVRGNTVGSPSFMAPITANTNRTGYFEIMVRIEHSNEIDAYSFYGIASNNTNPAAGDLTIYSINVRQMEPYTLYYHDFSDGTPGLLHRGAGEQVHFGVVDDPRSEGNKILRTSVEGPGFAGIDFKHYHLATQDLVIPSGSLIRASISARRTEGSPPLSQVTWRIATRAGDAVASWAAAQHRMALTTEFQTFTVTLQLPVGLDLHAFQFCKDNEAWADFMEFDWVRVEVLDSPPQMPPASWQPNSEVPSLAEAFADYFTVGNILDRLPGPELEEMFLHQYNSITMENAMKPGGMSPAKGVYTFDNADGVVNWAVENNLQVIGHTLVWHAQSPGWLYMNPNGTPLTYAEARENLEEFVTTVAGHFAGRIYAWDVLNELFHSGGGNANNRWWTNIRTNSINGHPWRAAYANQAPEGVNPWDFVYDAFMFTRKADPNAQLIYNDYNNDSVQKSENIRDMVNNINAIWATDIVNNPQAKESYGEPGLGENAAAWRANDVAIVQQYIDDGGRLLIEAIGGQTHFNITTNMNNARTALSNFTQAVGTKLHITEYDLGAGSGNSYNPVAQRTRYVEMFQWYMDNADKIERVTFWGVNDVQSWIATNATLFARPTVNDPTFRAKPALHDIAALPGTYAAPGLAHEVISNEDNTLVVKLTPQGGIGFAENLNASAFLALGTPAGISVTDVKADNGSVIVTVAGVPEFYGTFDVTIRVNKTQFVAGTQLNRIQGSWVGTRLIDPIVFVVEHILCKPGDTVVAIEPTYEAPGKWEIYCTFCGELIEYGEIDQLFRSTFGGTSPSQLNAALAQGNVLLTTPGSGGYGIAAGTTLTVPEGTTLYVETILNVRRGATLRIEGTVVILEGGRLNSDGHGTAQETGTIVIAEGGRLINEGYVEIAERSKLLNSGTITNNGTGGNLGRFEVRIRAMFMPGTIDGTRVLNIHRDAVIVPVTP